MKCQAAILRGVGKDWEIQEITLDPPRDGEVLVKMAVAGICHSDNHYTTGDGVFSPGLAAMAEAMGMPVPEFFPMLGGHEGAGVVEEVGNSRLFILLLFLVITLGINAFLTLPRDLNPQVKIPIVLVSTILPGAGPSDVESLVTVPIEDSINSLEKVKTVTSTSAGKRINGYGRI